MRSNHPQLRAASMTAKRISARSWIYERNKVLMIYYRFSLSFLVLRLDIEMYYRHIRRRSCGGGQCSFQGSAGFLRESIFWSRWSRKCEDSQFCGFSAILCRRGSDLKFPFGWKFDLSYDSRKVSSLSCFSCEGRSYCSHELTWKCRKLLNGMKISGHQKFFHRLSICNLFQNS